MKGIYLAVKRESLHTPPEWLITNGVNAGRWTRQFGVNCIADTVCAEFARNYCNFYDTVEGASYKVTLVQLTLELPDGIVQAGTAFEIVEE